MEKGCFDVNLLFDNILRIACWCNIQHFLKVHSLTVRCHNIITFKQHMISDELVATLNCTDKDKEPIESPEGCSELSIQAGDDIIPKFAILNDQIVTTANPIDYDTGEVKYTLFIVGVDYSTRDPRKSGTTTITVNIEPVNEFTPFIRGQPLEISVSISEILTAKVQTKILNVNESLT